MADNTTLNAGVGGDVIATDDIGGVKYQRVKAAWGVDGVATDVAATTPFPTSTNASIFRFSTNNTSVAQLASSATFTGTAETALDQPSISLLMTSDQPMTLTIRQFIDAGFTQAVPDIVYRIPASQGLSASFGLNGNYVQVLAQNTGTAATTTFSLNTAYGTLPTSDSSGRTPISQADSILLLSQTISAAGSSTVMDTMGYQSIVMQITGTWQGVGIFESSNDQTNWDTVLVLSRDSLAMQDLVTSGGLYSVKPSGRYLRFRVMKIIGSLVLNSIGRASQGISGADMLSLAMDRYNNTPLFTELNDSTVAKLAPANGMVLTTIPVPASTAINTVIFSTDISAYKGFVYYSTGNYGTGAYQVQVSLDGSNWVLAKSVDAAGVVNSAALSINATSGPNRVAVYAKFLRVILTTGTGTGQGTITLGLLNNATDNAVAVVNSVAVGTVSTVTSVTAVAAVSAINGSALTNGTTVGTLVSAATNNLTQIKGSLGRIYTLFATNTTATVQYLKLFALPSASVTMGTTAATLNFAIPVAANGGTLAVNINDLGLCLGGSGISYAITTGSSLTDNTATTAGAVLLNYAYI